MSLFLKALRGERIERFPVWLMRQAGRYMPEYRTLRSKAKDFLDFCSNVELATEVTLLPEKILGIDALILFSDILVPLLPLGIEVKFVPGEGPVLKAPPLEEWKEFEPSKVDYVFETVRRVKRKSNLPLIGFCGAPFTLGAYILEGKTAREFKEIRKTYYGNKKFFHTLMGKLSDVLIPYLENQIEAGVDAVQIFDSWANVMSPEMFEEYKPFLVKIAEGLKAKYPDIPIIYFFRGSGALFEYAKDLPFDTLSVDWTLQIERALREAPNKAIQGNLDPTILYASEDTIEKTVKGFLQRVAKIRKTLYVFNLGHGLAPDMDVQKVKKLVEAVKSFNF
jgi:uroporphyrinogen decarboxylase